MRKRHHTIRFTQEQMNLLEANPFTLKVSETKISYTLEFKNLFLSLYEEGATVKDIFQRLGYDIDVIGEGRMYSFCNRLLNQLDAGIPLSEDVSKKHVSKPMSIDYNTMPAQQSVAAMQRELTYLRQQVEFLKKISQLDTTKKSEK